MIARCIEKEQWSEIIGSRQYQRCNQNPVKHLIKIEPFTKADDGLTSSCFQVLSTLQPFVKVTHEVKVTEELFAKMFNGRNMLTIFGKISILDV